jgi:hypothetical protein
VSMDQKAATKRNRSHSSQCRLAIMIMGDMGDEYAADLCDLLASPTAGESKHKQRQACGRLTFVSMYLPQCATVGFMVFVNFAHNTRLIRHDAIIYTVACI